VEKEDSLPQMERYCRHEDLNRATSQLENTTSAIASLGILVAAIRETFEEAGLLLVYQDGGRIISFGDEEMEQKLLQYRDALNKGEVNFSQILEKEKFTLALDRLLYFSHWITPELSPVRYDARFFVAAVPAGQKALPDGEEVTSHVWITPAQALEKYRNRKFYMVAPTVITLEELSAFKTIQEVIDSTKAKNVKSVLTRLVFAADEVQEHTPDGRVFGNFTPAD
jgi:8-oxo-dGTP pyrophosphatase MutT (NUDIX family)